MRASFFINPTLKGVDQVSNKFTPQEAKRYSRLVKLLTLITKPFTRATITGLDNLPTTGKVIICPNHISNLDPIVTGTKLAKHRPIRALVKKSLTTTPIVKNVMTAMKHIPVDRGSETASEALETAAEALTDGTAIAIYPEGTIPKENYGELGALKTGAARLALETNSPLLPVGQWGIQVVLPPRQKLSIMHFLRVIFTRPRHHIVVGELIYPGTDDTVESINVKLRNQLLELIEKAKQEIV